MAIASHAIANRVCDPRSGWQNVKNICGFDRFLQQDLRSWFQKPGFRRERQPNGFLEELWVKMKYFRKKTAG